MHVTYRFNMSAGPKNIYRMKKLVPKLDGKRGPLFLAWVDSDMLSLYGDIEEQAARDEIQRRLNRAGRLRNPELTAAHQPQNDFDRRLLGLLMLETDVQIIRASIPFYDAVVVRGGSTSAERAAYLEVSTNRWNRIRNRFNTIKSIETELKSDDPWEDLPRQFE